MSSHTSKDSLEAMRDADRHASGDNSSHSKDNGPAVLGHEHTKAAGDQRDVEFKEDVVKVTRGQTNRGH